MGEMKLGFTIAPLDSNGLRILTWDTCGCRPAEKTEISLWDELAESKAKLAQVQSENAELTQRAETAELDRDWMRGQIQEGELIPVGLIYDIIGSFHAPDNNWKYLEIYAKMRAQQYAAER